MKFSAQKLQKLRPLAPASILSFFVYCNENFMAHMYSFIRVSALSEQHGKHN